MSSHKQRRKSSSAPHGKQAGGSGNADELIAEAIDGSITQLELLDALSDVEVGGRPIRIVVRQTVTGVVKDALEALGLPSGDAEIWAVTSVVTSYHEYVRMSSNTVGILEYLHAIHRSTGAYIAYLETGSAARKRS